MPEQYPASRGLSPLALPAAPAGGRGAVSAFVVTQARSEEDVRDAQRLRYRVFVEEMGARLEVAEEGVDADRFDPFCTHILVRHGVDGPVVGTYRLLSGEGARGAGSFIADELFDLAPLAELRHRSVELGRACVDPAMRGGVVLMLLWSAIARYSMAQGYEYLFGCASIDRSDGGGNAARVSARLTRQHLAPPELRVAPCTRLPAPVALPRGEGRISGALKGYLRMGAWVCGEPAWDRRFDTADLLVLLPMTRFVPRYAKHFLGRTTRKA